MATQDTLHISEFSFYEFCVSAQKAVKNGYEFSDKNEYMPQGYAGSYSATMVKVAASEDKPNTSSDVADDQSANTPPEVKLTQTKGRKPKTN